MEKFTNINIKGGDKTFSYAISYEEKPDVTSDMNSFPLVIKLYDTSISLIGRETNADRYNNEWVVGGYNGFLSTEYIPHSHNLIKIKLYFPRYSINVYKYVRYAFSIYTYIRGVKIILGNYIIKHEDSLATPTKLIYGNNYNESVEFNVANPRDILYSDQWKDFRINYCNETETEPNNECPILYYDLYPVNESQSGIYNTTIGYEGGKNSIDIDRNEYLSIDIHTATNPYSDLPFQIIGHINYSSLFPNLYEYIKHTYGIEAQDDTISCELFIYNKDSLFLNEVVKLLTIKDLQSDSDIYFSKDEISTDKWEDKDDLIELDGVFICCVLKIKNSAEPFIIKSNKIPVTQEVFKFLVDGNPSINIDKKTIDDMSININTVNKIINNVIQVDRINDSKSNIIQPVFFRTHDLSNIVIHPNVTENICLNLDLYKSKVDSFAIKIGDKTFAEAGRTSAGIIFKIIGGKLSKTQETTVYYVLNEKGEVITSGKYIYEI